MNAPRYIELTSAHRNRHNWPCPAEFVVPVTCINRGDSPRDARDKVVTGYPEYAWFQFPYAAPRSSNGPDKLREVNGKFYTALWPLARDPDNRGSEGAGSLTALKFAGGTAGSPILSSLMVNPPNVWLATNPPTPNISLNPYFCPIDNYFAGALLLRFREDPSFQLNASPYMWEGPCETSVILAYDGTTGTAFLENAFSDDFSEGDFYLVDFGTDPSDSWGDFVKGGPRIFIPRGSTGKNAYAGLYLQNYTWTKEGLDANDHSGFSRIKKYDERRRIAFLEDPVPLVDQLVCSEEGTPETFYGSNTFTLRDRVPTICRSLTRIGVSNGSIGEVTIEDPGQGYHRGELIASPHLDSYFSAYFKAPGVPFEYPIPDYILSGSGYGFLGAVSAVSATGGIEAIKILQQGAGYDVSCSYPLAVFTPRSYSGPVTHEGRTREKGTGSSCTLAFPQVFQSLEIYSRWGGDNVTTAKEGDFVFMPTIGQISTDGTANYSTSTTPPAMPRFAYMPSTADEACPKTSFEDLDIRLSGYPAHIDCKPESNHHVFPFSGTMQIGKIMRKDVTFSPMWYDVPGYPEEEAGGPVTVLLLDGGFDLAEAGLTDWGRPAYTGYSALPSSGILHYQDLEILEFSRDNEHALNYSGSTVSQNQMVCYAINLTSLTLPNIPLRNEIGGLIAFYPYVYVELSNVTAPSSGNKGVIYSNNPNANRALFRVTVDDQNTPLRSKFIKLDGDAAIQVVKFKPNDNLKFRVYLQNGMLFQTEQQDFAPPLHPDFFVQIGACFGIKRLS